MTCNDVNSLANYNITLHVYMLYIYIYNIYIYIYIYIYILCSMLYATDKVTNCIVTEKFGNKNVSFLCL